MIRLISYNIVCVFVGLVLVVTGLIHLQNIPGHFASVLNYRILSQDTAKWIAIVLPALHVFIGVALVFRELTEFAAASATILFAIYTSAQVLVFAFGIQINCGCIGTSGLEPVGMITICRTAILFLMFFFITMMERRAINRRMVGEVEL